MILRSVARQVWCGNLGDCRSCLIPLNVPESMAAAKAAKVLRLC